MATEVFVDPPFSIRHPRILSRSRRAAGCRLTGAERGLDISLGALGRPRVRLARVSAGQQGEVPHECFEQQLSALGHVRSFTALVNHALNLPLAHASFMSANVLEALQPLSDGSPHLGCAAGEKVTR